MIKRPDEINRIVNVLTNKGFEVYFAGQCAIASQLEEECQDWDIYTTCPQDLVRTLIPDGERLGSRLTRFDYAKEIPPQIPGAAPMIAGPVADVVTLEDSIEEQLKAYYYTAEAIAINAETKEVIDPYGGIEDIEKRLLKPMDPENITKKLQNDPIRIFTPIQYAAFYNFDFNMALSDAISESANYLGSTKKLDRLYYFRNIINAKYASKGMKMIAGLGVMLCIVGVANQYDKQGAEDFDKLIAHIDEIDHDVIRRMSLFYLCQNPKRYKDTVKYLPHETADGKYLFAALEHLQKTNTFDKVLMLKNYICTYGWDVFNFIDALSRDYSLMHGAKGKKMKKRDEILQKIRDNNEPVLMSEMAINEDDILRAKITYDRDVAKKLMRKCVDLVHSMPEQNDREVLLRYAVKCSRNKVRAAMTGWKILK